MLVLTGLAQLGPSPSAAAQPALDLQCPTDRMDAAAPRSWGVLVPQGWGTHGAGRPTFGVTSLPIRDMDGSNNSVGTVGKLR